jgi:hypothetical protein
MALDGNANGTMAQKPGPGASSTKAEEYGHPRFISRVVLKFDDEITP